MSLSLGGSLCKAGIHTRVRVRDRDNWVSNYGVNACVLLIPQRTNHYPLFWFLCRRITGNSTPFLRDFIDSMVTRGPLELTYRGPLTE